MSGIVGLIVVVVLLAVGALLGAMVENKFHWPFK